MRICYVLEDIYLAFYFSFDPKKQAISRQMGRGGRGPNLFKNECSKLRVHWILPIFITVLDTIANFCSSSTALRSTGVVLCAIGVTSELTRGGPCAFPVAQFELFVVSELNVFDHS